ncbi:uncharacterized protein LOC129598757 isoform X2 [Paramacrobiotus metropolitanus]|uniref:uncharacterized protein LOC129598757 isoform X2 n=1 Tax=Paramacrobiotus metropolitanus TaxID=2943436 RepID=UPI002445AA76|nr:uncharacterized protein LOC129598757 isoform X2 [Paramacrobiotus metropolitanus]
MANISTLLYGDHCHCRSRSSLPYYSVSNLPTIMIMGGITSWGQQACMRWSDWVLVAFSMERSLTIINPYRLEPLQRVATAQIITAFLLILSLAYGMFAFVKRYLYYIHWINDISAKLDNAPAWYPGWDEVDSAAKVIVQIVTFLLILIPSVILIVFLARHRKSAISTMRLQQKKPLRVTVKRSSSRSKVEINIILLSSAVLFLVTRSPSVVKTCLFQLANLSFDWSVIYFVSPFTDVAVYAGYSFTFFIYLLTERNFRENFLKLISPFRSDNTYIRRTGTKRCGEHFQMGLSTSAWAASACVERPTTSTWCRS